MTGLLPFSSEAGPDASCCARPGRRRAPLPLLAAFALAGAVYLPRLGAPLVWDDLQVIVHNPGMREPVPWRAYVSREYFRFSGNDTWRPLGTLGTRAAARLAGTSPFGQRLPWLLLHLAVAFLLLAWLRSLALPEEAAAWGAALFLLHPAHVETLMCATFNEDILVAAGLLGMLLAHRRGRPFVAALALAAAALSKEHGALGLPLAAGLDRLLPGSRARKGSWVLYSALLAAYAAFRYGILAGPQAAPDLAGRLPWTERLVDAAMAWVVTLRIFAVPLRLRIDYFSLPPSSVAEGLAWCAAALATLAALLWLAWRQRGKPEVALLILWPLPLLAATSPLMPANVLNIRLTAERFLYVPCLGAAAALAWALRRKPALLGALLAAWAGLSAARAADWSQESRLWSGLARIYPWSAKAHHGLGDAWLRQGRWEEAAGSYDAALRLRRDRADPVLAHYVPRTSELTWESPTTHRGLAIALLNLGRLREAQGQFERAIALAPASEGYSYRALAYLHASEGRFAEAKRVAGEGLSRHPADAMLARLRRDAEAGRLSFKAGFF